MTDAAAKDEIRNEIKAKRRMLTRDEINEASGRITERILSLDCYKNADTVMSYISAFKEPGTDVIILRLFADNKRVVVPISNTDTFTITPSYLTSPDKLIKGAYGIKEPAECIKADISDIDLALIPGIAFDTKGARIGFGKGYYDRFLAAFKGIKVGICYDFQLLDYVPSSPHDIKMDIIITEKRIYNDF
ncbi:MAG: 5-formyltetrahydrofolate cyclo-ligase [Candidatus Ornithomonoglobus sp.]